MNTNQRCSRLQLKRHGVKIKWRSYENPLSGTGRSARRLNFGEHGARAKRIRDASTWNRSAPQIRMHVTHFRVYLPLTHTDALEKLLQSQTDTASPNYHQWLTPAQFKQQFGPSRSDVAKTKQLLQSAGFTVVGENTQNLEVEGPVSAVESMFNTQIERVQVKPGHVSMAAANRHLTLPQSLAAMGAVIPEFAPHLQAHVHSHVVRPLADRHSCSAALGPLAGGAPAARLSTATSASTMRTT